MTEPSWDSALREDEFINSSAKDDLRKQWKKQQKSKKKMATIEERIQKHMDFAKTMLFSTFASTTVDRWVDPGYKKYSKEDFRSLPKEPLVKEILSGSIKLEKQQIKDRIQEHLDRL